MVTRDKKVALVTGGSRGIGRAICLKLATAGAHVVVASRSIESCAQVVNEVELLGGTASAVRCDMADRQSLEELAFWLRDTFERLDILVCNAAINPAFGPMSMISDNKYERIMNTNLKGNLHLCKLAEPLLASGSSVVVLSSIVGLTGSKNVGAYALSKAALLQLVRNYSVEWGPKNIRVNAISPGMTRTDLGEVAIQSAEGRKLIERTPLGRAAEPNEIANVALFLSSENSSFITGQNIIVDGGITTADFS